MDMDSREGEILPNIDTILEEFFSDHGYPKEVLEYTKKSLLHLVPDHFNAASGFHFPKFYQILKPNATKQELETALSLGWIYQIFHAYTSALDDYLEESKMRYGKPTWSNVQGHSKAVMLPDLWIVRAVVFFALQKDFSHIPSVYLQLLQLILDADMKYSKSMRLQKHQFTGDLRDGKTSLESFNMNTYRLIFTLQINVFLYLQLAWVMTIAGYKMDEHRDLYRSVEVLCDDFALALKISDDYNEIFNHSMHNETSEDDIRTGQFTWLFLMAKESCVSKDQITDLLNHYGKDNDESVLYVKALLEKIGIHDLYQRVRKELTETITKKANNIFGEHTEIKEMFLAHYDYWLKFMN